MGYELTTAPVGMGIDMFPALEKTQNDLKRYHRACTRIMQELMVPYSAISIPSSRGPYHRFEVDRGIELTIPFRGENFKRFGYPGPLSLSARTLIWKMYEIMQAEFGDGISCWTRTTSGVLDNDPERVGQYSRSQINANDLAYGRWELLETAQRWCEWWYLRNWTHGAGVYRAKVHEVAKIMRGIYALRKWHSFRIPPNVASDDSVPSQREGTLASDEDKGSHETSHRHDDEDVAGQQPHTGPSSGNTKDPPPQKRARLDDARPYSPISSPYVPFGYGPVIERGQVVSGSPNLMELNERAWDDYHQRELILVLRISYDIVTSPESSSLVSSFDFGDW